MSEECSSMPGAYTPNSKVDLWRKPKQYARQKKAANRKGEGDEHKNQAAKMADA